MNNYCGECEWEYYIVKDEFLLYFPEGDYDIHLLVDWYKTIPTHPEKIAYYGDNTDLLKRHFEKFSTFTEVHTKVTNDFHSNLVLYVWCIAIYNLRGELVGFSAQEFIEGKPANKKICYFGELE